MSMNKNFFFYKMCQNMERFLQKKNYNKERKNFYDKKVKKKK